MASSPQAISVRIAATFTAEPLLPVLEAWCEGLGLRSDVGFAPFNQVHQQLLDPGSLLAGNGGGVNVVMVRPSDLAVDSALRGRAAARELAAALGEAAARDGVQTLVLVCPAADAGEVEGTFSHDLADQLAPVQGVELLDAGELERRYPVDDAFDTATDAAVRVPYREEMFVALATFLARRIVALRRKPYKVIAVDCDNTLWSGVCGELGSKGVVVDEPRQAFQQFLIDRRAEGFLLCMVSKNSVEDVEAVFREHPDMLIPRTAFIDAAINWDPKSANLRRLAERLGLGLDGFLFLDDNPAEIAEVEANVPAVLALRLPEDPAELAEFVEHLWALDRAESSAEDAERADFYHDEALRRGLLERAKTFEAFIESLQLQVDIEPVTEVDVARASQLSKRTNQFNACPQPRDDAAMLKACRGMRPELVNARDRFGDYGTVGLMLTREDSGRLWAETFLLSCRALGKGVEHRMLRHLGHLALDRGLDEVAIWYNDTGRNQPCRDFLESIDAGRWEDGLRVIPAMQAAGCLLRPVAAKAVSAAGETSMPILEPRFAARIAHELRRVDAIRGWSTPALRPRPDLGEAFAPPLGETEETVAAIWREVLGLEQVGRNDRFVDLGGSSLQLVRVHARLRRGFGEGFELVRLFEHPTPASQARLVQGIEDRAADGIVVETGEDAGDGDAIAIVGMGLRLPGASSPEELWEHLRDGVDSVTRFGPDELEVPAPEGEDLIRARGLLDPEVFEGLDGGLFGIVPREAEIIDPQQRVFLEICWEALERAGYVPDDAEASGCRVGVYAGCYYDTYLPHHILSDPETHRRHLAEAQVGALQVEFGNDKDHLATRVAFKLNLKGPSLSVQTACSTSLVAVAHAVMSLRSGHCDMALAGGVTVTVPQKRGYRHVEGGMLSGDGYCRPFDARSSGTVFSNGAGVVLLKRLSDARRDGDHIHAVLRGFGINNDGGVKHSYAAPSVDGQADVIRRAHRDAGVDPRTITYVEAHGTATPLGDPIEVAGLTAAFRAATSDNGFCALGSLKSNIGHLDTAAGVCGLIKTAMSLEHGELPAVLHFTEPNPRIDFANSPFFVNDRLRRWEPVPGTPRRAGVSSFGVGGTNVHVVLEEAPAMKAAGKAPEPAERLLVLSGRNEAALEQLADRLAAHAAGADDCSFAAAARTLAMGRKAMPRRAAVVARDWESAADQLRARRWGKAEAHAEAPGLVWMFPGQGAQHPGMTADLYVSEPGFRADIDRCAGLLMDELGEDLRETLFAKSGDAAERLKHTVMAQPAIFVVEYALARQWQRWGIEPGLMLGHSVGEFAAACFAGVFALEDGLKILATRGRLMGELPGGSMLSVRLAADELRPRLPENLDLAAENGPALSVVAGEREAVAAFAAELAADGVAARELHTSHAFHSRMMDPVVERFRSVIAGAALAAPRIPIFSTVTGAPMREEDATDPGYWAAHLRRTVRFHGALDAAAAEQEGRIYLEVGPGQTLATLARQTVGRRAAACLASCEHPASEAPDRKRMLQTLGELWCRGVAVDWTAVHADAPALRVPLPTYPFQRKRHWLPCRLLDAPLVAPTCATPAARDLAEAGPQPDSGEEQPQRSGSDGADDITTGSRQSGAAGTPVGVIDRVRQVLEDLSGIPADEMTEDAGFLELGFDSLLLTQAARELQNTFGTPITFRDLMQATPTFGTLAAHLEANGAVIEADATVAAKPAADPAPVAEAEAAPEPESGVAGPRTRIDRVASGDELSPQQREHLDGLIGRYNAKTRKSKELTQEHRRWHADPRTVNGFNRLCKEMVYQIVAERMKGCRMWDVDDNEYIDMVNGFGPNFLGHSPDYVSDAIREQLATGLEIGPQCRAAMETAKLFCEVTGNERVCFLNTGSEAVQAAMRIARTVTGRDKVLVFDKDYHGNFDPVLVRSVGKGARRRTLPLAPGIPDSAVNDIIVVPWGRPEALDMIREVAGELAAVLVEPVQSRQPELIPVEFVHEVKKLSEENGFLLVFDEVITGLRQGLRGAQELYGIRADLATYGKVFGGGALPIGVIGGKARYMDTFDGGQWQYGDDSFPEKEVTFFAGTFVRLPLAMAACRAVLNHLKEQGPDYWDAIGDRADRLARSVDRLFRDNGIDVRMVNHGSQMYLRIGDRAKHANLIFYHLREKGVFAMEGLPFYLTAAHSDEDVEIVIEAFRQTIAELQQGGFFPQPALPEVTGLPAGVRGPFPMTEPMVEIRLASLLGREANLAFNEMLQLRLQGAVDPALVRTAVQDLVDRHDALRLRVPDEHAIAFVIDPAREASVIEADLRDHADPEAALAEMGRRERETEFDLARGPVFRVVLARMGEEEAVLQFSAHHIACDGWSFEVLIKDFTACYEARKAGRRPALPPPPSIVDRALGGTDADADDEALGWWRDRFADGAPEIELPLRRGYGMKPSYASATAELMLGREELESLRKLAAGCNVTLNSALLAGFQALLHRLSGQDSFVITFPSAGQMKAGDEDLVGHCVNFLPMLVEVDPLKSFSDLAGSASTAQFDALEHGEITYGRLLRELGIVREGGRRPLMEVIFNFEPSGDPGSFGGLRSKVETVAARYSNSTIFLNLMQTPEGLLLSSTYNHTLIDAGMMRHWLEALRVLLLDAAREPGRGVGELALLDDDGRRELAAWSGGGDDGVLRPVGDLFRETCTAHASRTALSWGGGDWTYAELGERVGGFAAALRQAGVRPGERVGICLPRGRDLIAATLGVLAAGACYVPIEPGYPELRRREILNDAAATALITMGEAPAGTELTVVHPQLVGQALPVVTRRVADDPAYVMYTSGSTGKPKGVVVPHRGIARLVKCADYCDLGPDEVILQASTIAFDAATFEVFGALLNGGRLVLVDEADTTLAGIARTVREQGVSTMWLTSGLFELMVEEHLDDLRGVRQLLAGGDVLSPDHVRRACEALPDTRIINGYGPTENSTFTTCHTIRAEDLDGSAIPIGRPIAGTRVRIVDAGGREMPVGVPGELQCGGTGLALGYLGQPGLTAEHFIDEAAWYRSGDICRWLADGRIEFVGRGDEQVKLRGFRIELGEIEAALAGHPGVRRCKVAVRGSGAGGKRLLAWFCAEPGVTVDGGTLRDWLRQRLPAFMRPDAIEAVGEMPLNGNGKIDITALPEPQASAAVEGQPPSGPVERKLAAIWCEILGCDELRREDNFFDLGGNSLGGLRMFARIRRECGVSLRLATLLEAPSLRMLAASIEAANDSSAPADDDSEAESPVVTVERASRLSVVRSGEDLEPVVAIHGGDGGILFYRELAERLPAGRPFMAIESPELGNSDAIEVDSVEVTAAEYVRLLKAAQGRGPYLLAGYSFGGVVAYEMARQMAEAGDEILMLALMDTLNPAVPVKQYSLPERLSVFWNARREEPLIGRLKSLAVRFREGVGTNLRVRSEVAAARRSQAAEAHSELRSVQLREAHYEVMKAYQPKPYPGVLTLFRAANVCDKFEFPAEYGWTGLAEELRIIDVPGEHLTIFDPENAADLARKFAAHLPGHSGTPSVRQQPRRAPSAARRTDRAHSITQS